MKTFSKKQIKDEWLDVVDENNQIIDQAKRGDIHDKGAKAPGSPYSDLQPAGRSIFTKTITE